MKLILTFFIILSFSQVQAQLVSDILRYSYFEDFGTARSLAIGNSISPLGGDFYTMATNPAGLATYRYSEFTLSTGFRNIQVDSDLSNAGVFSEDKNDIVLNNLGMVIVHNTQSSSWKTVNFGIGYNRNTSFDQRSFYRAATKGSITDRWLERANGVLLDDLLNYESGLAYDAGALYSIDPDIDNGEYGSDYELYGDSLLNKNEQMSSTGGLGEFTFTFGGNYKNKLYLGASFGIPFVKYSSRRSYKEDDSKNNRIPVFESLEYSEVLRTSGEGINAKLGVIYLISHAVRWSFHFESGSRITVLDEFSNSLSYSYNEGNGPVTKTVEYPGDNEKLKFEYTMITPYQLSTGLGFIIGKSGFITATVDFTDYSFANFEFDPDLSSSEDLAYERELNRAIDSLFTSAFTLRVGGELAIESFRLRAGTVLKQRPYAQDSGFDYGYSAGIGVRIDRIFLDFAYRRFVEKSTYTPYSINDTDLYSVQHVDNQKIYNDFLLTFGIKF